MTFIPKAILSNAPQLVVIDMRSASLNGHRSMKDLMIRVLIQSAL